ncbi:putative beta-L-arabinofuranosidase, GH127 [Lyophyllum shimeji]|uniref:Beta-L-arabinofuranosidase, GH127 n=1 Tax=Lyophyllum shimeji TaxID=47721 RepID=A0A9P3UMX8_LYOSH|nr:putative beta-L-arabinofuranosidase, GH127 [Lyophyllum shimeji]
MRGPLIIIAALASSGIAATLLPPLYKRLPTGSIKPAGWALDQAHIQADGLAGHLRDFDSYVNGSIWVEGGSIEYSDMHEAAPYWFNGQVALAFQLQDQRLIGQVRSFLDWTLAHQGDDGWIGPEPFVANATTPRLVWPRYLVLLGMIQYAEADPSQAERIIDAMHRFFVLANNIWKTGQQGVPSMGFQFDYQYVRWEELVYSLQWLYDNAPRGKEEMLLETMQLVRNQGFSWKNNWYTDAAFPKTAVTSFTMQTHGVNNGEALKSEALAWRFTGDETDKQNTFDRIDMVYKYHGRASGTFSADEHFAGLDPSRGTELCAVVEQIFSLATIYQTFGNNSVADRAEKLAYNALPAAIMHDWWSHQYDQEVNQIWAQTMNPAPWGNNGPNSNVFGFEPNYPCCTVNHPQGYPKFWAHSFFSDHAGTTLVHALLGPATFAGTLGKSDQVKVTVDTLYPFGSTLTYAITATRPFTFGIRVPTWAQNDLSTISVNGAKAKALKADSESLQTVQVEAGTTSVRLFLNAPLQIETRTNGAVAITRGALNYALEIAHNTTTTPALRSGQALNDVKRLYPDAPAQYLTPTDPNTKDNTLLPTSEWRLAIDPSTIVVHDDSTKTSKLPYYVWAPGSSPVTMTASACQIEWGLTRGTASAPPTSPVQCVGPVFTAKLVPFASAKLRLGEIPTMKTT